jgi:hypothetical protein
MPPFVATSDFGIPNPFDVRVIVRVQLFSMINRLALGIENAAGMLRSLWAYGKAAVICLLHEIAFLGWHSGKTSLHLFYSSVRGHFQW